LCRSNEFIATLAESRSIMAQIAALIADPGGGPLTQIAG